MNKDYLVILDSVNFFNEFTQEKKRKSPRPIPILSYTKPMSILSCRATLLPPKTDFETPSILKALNFASREVGELKGYCTNVQNIKVLMSLAMSKESVESPSIEEIQTTVASVLKSRVIPESEQKIQNIKNFRYQEAVYWAMEGIADLSISTRLILGIHHKLLKISVGYRKMK